MALASLTRPELVFLDLPATDRLTLLHELARRLAVVRRITDPEPLFAKLREREELGSTAVGGGVAIPHCKLETPAAPALVAVAVSEAGVDFGAADGEPVRLFFLVVSPAGAPAEHLQALATISRWVRLPGHVSRLLAIADRRATRSPGASEGTLTNAIYALLGEES